MKRFVSGRLLVCVALLIGTVAIIIFLPIKHALEQSIDWVEGLGLWGLVVLTAAYIPACVLLVPGTLITFVAGFLYGVVPTTVAISIGSTLGASAAFWVGRTLARGWVERKLAGYPRFRALDQAVAAQGFKIVFLTRLSPALPFNLLNYAFGLTRVRFRDYFFASWIGMLPGTVLYAYIGSAAKSLADIFATRSETTAAETALLYVGLALTVVLTLYVARIAKRALDQSVGASNGGVSRPHHDGERAAP